MATLIDATHSRRIAHQEASANAQKPGDSFYRIPRPAILPSYGQISRSGNARLPIRITIRRPRSEQRISALFKTLQGEDVMMSVPGRFTKHDYPARRHAHKFFRHPERLAN